MSEKIIQDTLWEKRLEVEGRSQVPLSSYLQEKYEREKQRGTLQSLGYPLKKFKRLATNIDGIQPGFYVVSAETNVGKTAFLTNLFLDILDENIEVQGLYCSLDDSRDVIINRFIGIRTGLNLNQIQRRQSDPKDQETIGQCYQHLIDLHKARRLEIKDIAGIRCVEHLEDEIKHRAGQKLVVFVDGLYNLGIGQGLNGIREMNIDRANQVKALADTYKIPILTSGELRKRQGAERKPDINDLMETGKLGYNANLVLLLYAQDLAKFKTEENPVLIMDYAKNKLSHFRGFQQLRFTRAKGIICEQEYSPYEK